MGSVIFLLVGVLGAIAAFYLTTFGQ